MIYLPIPSTHCSPNFQHSHPRSAHFPCTNQQCPSLLTSHAVLTTSAIPLFFPLGTLLTRLDLPAPHLSYHAPFQILGLALAISGVSIGIPSANLSRYSISGNAHIIIRLLVVFLLLPFQPLGGWLQNRYYKRYRGRGV